MENVMTIMGRRVKVGMMMCLCTVLLAFGLFGSDVYANGAGLKITKEDGTEATKDEDYSYSTGVLTILKSGSYTVSMVNASGSTSDRIAIGDGNGDPIDVTLTLDNVSIDTHEVVGSYVYPIRCMQDTDEFTLKLKGKNELTSSQYVICFESSANTGDFNIYGLNQGNETGSLTVDYSSESSRCVFTQEHPLIFNSGTINVLNGKIMAKEVTIHGGKLIINNPISQIAADSLTVTGGELYVGYEGDSQFFESINLQNKYVQTGGVVTLSKSMNMSSKSGVVINIPDSGGNYPNDAVDISGGKLLIDYNTTGELGTDGIVVCNGDRNICISKNAYVSIKGTTYGIDAQQQYDGNGKLEISGGNMEITAKTGAIRYGYQGEDYPLSFLLFDKGFSHKNYNGESAKTRKEISDTELKKLHPALIGGYLLITPVRKITYNLGGGTLPSGKSNPNSYTMADKFTLVNPTRDGYSFTGWTGSGYKNPTKTVTVDGSKGNVENLTFTANWTKQKIAKVTKAPTAKSLVYSEAAQELINKGTAQNGTMEYAVSNTSSAPSKGWSTSVPKQTKDGTYTVWYRAKGNSGYATSKAASVKVTIHAFNIQLKSKSAKYNGKTPKITIKSVKYGKKTVSKKKSDYTITYSPSKFQNAGKYTITFKFKKTGSYNGKTGTATFTIDKAANPMTVKAKKTISVKASELTTKGKTYAVDQVLKFKNKKTKVTYSISSKNNIIIDKNTGTVTVPKGLKKGTYSAKVTVKAAADTNYKEVTKNATIKVKVTK